MQTGIVQPSGPSNHVWISFGSVWARYTRCGAAAKRLVTITWVSPSVRNVIWLIVPVLSLAVGDSSWPARRLTARNWFPMPFAASQATHPWRRRPHGSDGEAALHRPRGEPRVP